MKELVSILNCSQSAIWNNLTQLRKSRILSYGNLETKGIPVKLTRIGKLIYENLTEAG